MVYIYLDSNMTTCIIYFVCVCVYNLSCLFASYTKQVVKALKNTTDITVVQ